METQSKAPRPDTQVKRRVRRRRRPRGRGDGLAVRLQEVERLLAAAAREAFGQSFGFGRDQARPFAMALNVIVEPGPAWQLRADPPLREQVVAAVREMGAQAEAFRSGRVYCYRCESPECAHSMPPRPSSVFGGYTSTGLPCWPELTQLLLDLRHPRPELLFEAQNQGLVAAYVDAEAIKALQLDVFGRASKAYNILGQVAFGFLLIHDRGERAADPQRVALTLQAVESRRLDGSPRLDLNVLGRLEDGASPLEALAQGGYQRRVVDLIAQTRRRIQQLAPAPGGGKGGREPPGLRPHVPLKAAQILRETTRGLERIGRQTGRRTAHAEERRADQRPTSKAWEDTAAAASEHVLWDDRRRTFIVLGPKGRVHVFSPDGRHVTSLLVDGDAVQGRLRRRRWRRVSGEALDQFRGAVGRRNGEGPPSRPEESAANGLARGGSDDS